MFCTWPIFLTVGSSSSTNIWLHIQPRFTLSWNPWEALVDWILCCWCLEIWRLPLSQPDKMKIIRSTWRTEQLYIVENFLLSFSLNECFIKCWNFVSWWWLEKWGIRWCRTPLMGNNIFLLLLKNSKTWICWVTKRE